MKNIFSILCSGSILLTLGFSSAFSAEIVLGLSFGKTGIYSTINKTTEIAVDIAVNEINSTGGIKGKKITCSKI